MPQTQRSVSIRGRRHGGPREARRPSAVKRTMILETAIEVFAEKGFHDTRISDIAQRAEVAYGLVYHYFRNKEAILDTIFRERWGAFMAAIREIAAADRPIREKLRGFADVILSVHRERPEWVRVLVLEIQRTERLLEPDAIEAIGEFYRLFEGMLREGQARGELRADLDPKLAGALFVGGLDLVLTSRALDLLDVDASDAGDAGEASHARLADGVVELFLNGMAMGTT